jgi:site-specific recombinase XerD
VALLARLLGELRKAPPTSRAPDLQRARNEWLRRLQAARRSESAVTAYRIAIDDLLDWCGGRDRSIFDEATIVDYLADYQRRADPAPATYYRRFGLLRRFVRWLSRRSGTPDPFLDLEAPPKPQQEADGLTEQEFGRLLSAAEHPPRRRAGLAERDRLVLLTLVQTDSVGPS